MHGGPRSTCSLIRLYSVLEPFTGGGRARRSPLNFMDLWFMFTPTEPACNSDPQRWCPLLCVYVLFWLLTGAGGEINFLNIHRREEKKKRELESLVSPEFSERLDWIPFRSISIPCEPKGKQEYQAVKQLGCRWSCLLANFDWESRSHNQQQRRVCVSSQLPAFPYVILPLDIFHHVGSQSGATIKCHVSATFLTVDSSHVQNKQISCS